MSEEILEFIGPIQRKICRGCRSPVLLDGFNASKTGAGGKDARCKQCTRKHCNDWYASDSPKAIASVKKQRARCATEKETRLKRRQDRPVRCLFNSAKQRAGRKNLSFTITPEDIVIPEFCPVLGTRLVREVDGVKKKQFATGDTSPSIDRIDSSRGYEPDNIAVISWRANTLKNNGTLEEFERLIEWLKTLNLPQAQQDRSQQAA